MRSSQYKKGRRRAKKEAHASLTLSAFLNFVTSGVEERRNKKREKGLLSIFHITPIFILGEWAWRGEEGKITGRGEEYKR